MRPVKGFKYARAEIKSGNQLEIEIYPSFRKQLPDMIKRFESTEARKSLNDRNSRKKLMRLVHENFYEGDYWMTLTYEKKSKDVDEAKWIYGMTNIKTMKYRGKEENFLGITGYMVKDPKVYKKTAFRLKGARTWARSKGNLIVPEPRVNKGKYSKRKITELALNHSELVEFLIAEYPQYDFKEVEVRHNDYNGLFYIYARMQDKNRRVRR